MRKSFLLPVILFCFAFSFHGADGTEAPELPTSFGFLQSEVKKYWRKYELYKPENWNGIQNNFACLVDREYGFTLRLNKEDLEIVVANALIHIYKCCEAEGIDFDAFSSASDMFAYLMESGYWNNLLEERLYSMQKSMRESGW
ncbi:hypothetical protein HOD08_02620 [bacterium]|nr:hypothetical protein [bacterium]